MLKYRESRNGISFLQFFKIVFVIFFLYLLGDAFYRWDGFKYYGTFDEFIPAVALISVLWFIFTVAISTLLWLSLLLLLKILKLFRLNLQESQLVIFGFTFFISGLVAWGLKKAMFHDIQVPFKIKLLVFTLVWVFSLVATFLLRGKANEIINRLNKRLTPLIWLFGTIIFSSIPIVIFNMQLDYEASAMEEINAREATYIKRPNIILVTFDALTARDMSLYGYHKKTTPFIDEWAKEAMVFTRAEAASNYTAPTTASLMTGKRVWTHRRFQSEGTGVFKSETENISSLLKKAGYTTMAFVSNELASVERLGMSESFMIAPPFCDFMSPSSMFEFLRKYLYKFFGKKISFYFWILKEDFILNRVIPDYEYLKLPFRLEFPVEKVFGAFLTEVENNPRRSYFAWIHVFPPHAPYLPPEQYVGLFDSSKEFRKWRDQLQVIRPRYFSQTQQQEADILRARYDEFIRYCDDEFKNFINQLEAMGQLENTVIILSSDHGESFEHGYFTHGGPFLFEQMTHIPLIIKEPGQTKGRIIDLPVEQIDISATILDYAGVTIPPWVEGRSLRPLLERNDIKQRPIFSMNLEKNRARGYRIEKGTVAIWKGDYKLIHFLEENQSLLFNLMEDPDELYDLFNKEPEVAQHLLDLIKENLRRANERIINLGD
jgi:arylsulfatase A-like enzyme